MENLFIGKELAELLTKAKEIKETNTGNLLRRFAFESVDLSSWLNKGEETPNYLNISKDEIGKISYATQRKIELYSWESDEDIYGNHTQRFKAKVGKTLKKIFISSILEERGVTPQDIEIFVDQLKALAGEDENSFGSMEITHNFDYYEESYTSDYAQEGNGSLGESCMRYDNCVEDGYFHIYADNCSMLINKDDDGLVDVRALLWKTTCGTKVMDRIYTDEHFKEERFKAWANKNGYIYKEKQSYSHKVDFVSNGDVLKNKYFLIELSEDISQYSRFPYMDTFTYAFEDDDGVWYLTNNPKEVYHTQGVKEFRKFESTDGDYGRFSLTEVKKIAFVNGKLDLIDSICDNSNYRNEFICETTFHKESELYKLFQSNFSEDEINSGFTLNLSTDAIYSCEEVYSHAVWSRDVDLQRKMSLDSETFYCESSGDRFFNSVPKIETYDGRICAEQNIYIDYKGRVIRGCDSRIVSVKGKPKIVCGNDESIVNTFDGITRLSSECVELEFQGRIRVFSKVVHKDLIKSIEKSNEKIREMKSHWNEITLKRISEGNFDGRRKF